MSFLTKIFQLKIGPVYEIKVGKSDILDELARRALTAYKPAYL